MKHLISLAILLSITSTAISQSNPCGFVLVSTAASCDTCCDACLAVAITGNCSNTTYTITWSPFYDACNACPGTTYTATILDNYGNTIIDSILVDTVQVNLSVPSLNLQNSFEVYPNPVKTDLNLELSVQKEYQDINLIIYNLLGEKVFETPFSDNTIPVDFLEKGIYIISAVANNIVLAHSKFIKE